jgi:Rrf2 family iron-sulfur cluster assembly transcriptional regulator
MLEITRQADYALRAVRDVARLPEGERLPTAVIAERQKIPLPFLAKIISQLAVKGILEATRGASGGVSLARPAASITLLEVIEAIDGPITLNRCVRDPNACEFSEECPISDIFRESQEMLVQRLQAVTFADVIRLEEGRA